MARRYGDLVLTGHNDDPEGDRAAALEVDAGRLHRVADGIYAAANGRPVEEIACGGWAYVLARLAPGAVLDGRSGLHLSPWREADADGHRRFPGYVFAVDPAATGETRTSLPGLVIVTVPGPGAVDGDIPYLGVHLPGSARRLLDNLREPDPGTGPSRTLGRAGVEAEAERILRTGGAGALLGIRTHAARIAPALGAMDRLSALSDVVETLVGWCDAPISSRAVAARTRRTAPYDPDCMDRLRLLAKALDDAAPDPVPDPHAGTEAGACVSFVEAYFSNLIEGIRFPVEVARGIVVHGVVPAGREADARDLSQTHAQLAAILPGAARASSPGAFVDELRERHRSLLDARPESRPGSLKAVPNAAGNTVFVAPDLVDGTLREGVALLESTGSPFARAVLVHALVAQVHPFEDGNGRLARIMSTAELVGAGQSRAVVTPIYRSDYIAGLRCLSGDRKDAGPLVRALLRCQAVTAGTAARDIDGTIRLWATTHAFLEDERGARLTDPDPAAAIGWHRGVPAPTAYWAGREAVAGPNDLAALLGR